jgi:hypothetical protein
MRASSSHAVLAAAVALAACDRHEPLVICHNANCASPDVTRDDTLDALDESLHLTHDGLPALDGMELDTFWYGAGAECLFAHDLDGDTSVPATEAADMIASYLATSTRPGWQADRFHVFLDFKPNVGPSYSDAHSPEQLVLHAECVLDLVDRIVAGARTGGHAVSFGLISQVPRALEVLTEQPRWGAYAGQPDVEILLVGDIFAPYSSLVPDLADFEHLDAVEYHPDFMTEPKRETYRSLGIELVQWSFVTTSEALDAIDRWEPRYAITNEARLVRRWTQN